MARLTTGSAWQAGAGIAQPGAHRGRGAGFDAKAAAHLFRAYSYYVIGVALDETSGHAKGPSSLFPVPAQETEARFPRVAEVGPYFKREYFDTTFAARLEILLEGFQRARG